MGWGGVGVGIGGTVAAGGVDKVVLGVFWVEGTVVTGEYSPTFDISTFSVIVGAFCWHAHLNPHHDMLVMCSHTEESSANQHDYTSVCVGD